MTTAVALYLSASARISRVWISAALTLPSNTVEQCSTLPRIVEAQQNDGLVFHPEKTRQQVVPEILRAGQNDTIGILILIIPPEQLTAEAQQHRRVWGDAFHAAELFVFRLEYPGQAPKRIDQAMGEGIGILAGNAVIEQHLEQLMGTQPIQASLEKLLFEALAVPAVNALSHAGAPPLSLILTFSGCPAYKGPERRPCTGGIHRAPRTPLPWRRRSGKARRS